MINFGMEFAVQNKEKMPDRAVVILGNKDDLGAGYDGQIFYNKSPQHLGITFKKQIQSIYSYEICSTP